VNVIKIRCNVLSYVNVKVVKIVQMGKNLMIMVMILTVRMSLRGRKSKYNKMKKIIIITKATKKIKT